MDKVMDFKHKYGKVAVIMGGDSPEREVSLISGAAVLNSLINSGVDAHKFDPLERPLSQLSSDGFARAFLVTHGKRGEDGILQGALEQLRIPYTGSKVMASSLAMDKYRTKLIWQAIGVPIAKSQYVLKSGFDYTQFVLEVQLPVVVKPVSEGSTLGLSKVYELSELEPAIELAFSRDNALLIEKLIVGDEFTVTICDGKVYPLVKIEAPAGNYDYQNKYFTHDTVYICPVNLGVLQAQIEEYARAAYQAIGACGVARLDFMVAKAGQIYFLEINTLPGMTDHSLVPIAFKAAGINFAKLCLMILDGAALSD
jgi:D-alanine-D-alanine ligase